MNEFDYKQLDSIIHSRIRLAVMSILIGVEQAEFKFLKEQVKATDGNLSTHLSKLGKAGYIEVSKSFLNRKPVSNYQITKKGEEAFKFYISRLEGLLGK